MNRVALLAKQLADVRQYTLRLLATVPHERWFDPGTVGTTHLAWQAGHLAVAEYSLAVERMRGSRPGDEQLLPGEFRARFSKGTRAEPASHGHPGPAEIVAVLERIHAEALRVVGALVESQLDEPMTRPHPLFTDRQGALLWCAQHEMLHAGQIGLLRRGLGMDPLW